MPKFTFGRKLVAKLSSVEREELEDMFNRLDTSKDGWINAEKLLAAITCAVGTAPSMEAVKKVATQMDHAPASNPGVPHFISLLEFLEYCAAARQAAQQGQSYEEVARSDQGQLVQETGHTLWELLLLFRRKQMLTDFVQGGEARLELHRRMAFMLAHREEGADTGELSPAPRSPGPGGRGGVGGGARSLLAGRHQSSSSSSSLRGSRNSRPASVPERSLQAVDSSSRELSERSTSASSRGSRRLRGPGSPGGSSHLQRSHLPANAAVSSPLGRASSLPVPSPAPMSTGVAKPRVKPAVLQPTPSVDLECGALASLLAVDTGEGTGTGRASHLSIEPPGRSDAAEAISVVSQGPGEVNQQNHEQWSLSRGALNSQASLRSYLDAGQPTDFHVIGQLTVRQHAVVAEAGRPTSPKARARSPGIHAALQGQHAVSTGDVDPPVHLQRRQQAAPAKADARRLLSDSDTASAAASQQHAAGQTPHSQAAEEPQSQHKLSPFSGLQVLVPEDDDEGGQGHSSLSPGQYQVTFVHATEPVLLQVVASGNAAGGGSSAAAGDVAAAGDTARAASMLPHNSLPVSPSILQHSTTSSSGAHMSSHGHSTSRFKASAQPQQDRPGSSTPLLSLSPSAATASMYELGLAPAVQAAVLSGSASTLAAALEQRSRLITALSPTPTQHRHSSRQGGQRRATWDASATSPNTKRAPSPAPTPENRSQSPLVTSILKQLLRPGSGGHHVTTSSLLNTPLSPGGGLGAQSPRSPQPPWWGRQSPVASARGGLPSRPASATAGGVLGLPADRPLQAGELHMHTLLAMPAPLSRTLQTTQGTPTSATTYGSPVSPGMSSAGRYHSITSVPALPTSTPATGTFPGSHAAHVASHARKAESGRASAPSSPAGRSSHTRGATSPLPHYLAHTPSAAPVLLDVVTPAEDQDPLLAALPGWVQRSLSRQLRQDCHVKESDQGHHQSALPSSPASRPSSADRTSRLHSQIVSPSPVARSHQHLPDPDIEQGSVCSDMDQFDQEVAALMSSAEHANRMPSEHIAATQQQQEQQQVQPVQVQLWSTEYVPIKCGPRSQSSDKPRGARRKGPYQPPVVRLNKASMMRIQAAHAEEPPLAAGLTALLLQRPMVDAQLQAQQILAKLSQAAQFGSPWTG